MEAVFGGIEVSVLQLLRLKQAFYDELTSNSRGKADC